jgi:hypothetical protein
MNDEEWSVWEDGNHGRDEREVVLRRSVTPHGSIETRCNNSMPSSIYSLPLRVAKYR